MSQPSASNHDSVELSVQRRVDEVCLRFEAAWKAGQRPKIEAYLGDAPEPERSLLLEELLKIEAEYRFRSGEALNPDEYRRRFPEHLAVVHAVFAKSAAALPPAHPAAAHSSGAAVGDDGWFYARNRQKVGPCSWSQLRQLAALGQLQPSDMVWQEGSAKWVQAASLKDLFSAAEDSRGEKPASASEAPGAGREGSRMDTPASLLERLRQLADHEAWARFVKLYTPLIFHWARRVDLQEQDAADLVQDVFTVLVQKMPEFAYDQQKTFRGWLRAVTLNKWRERQRHRAGEQARERAHAAREPVSPDTAEAFWEAEYRQHLVRQALQLMRSEFEATTWKACWEHVVSGKSAAEVAAQLGISTGAVRAAKFRVLARLRRELDQLLD